ncbi:Ribosomal protein L11 methylase [Streptococcus suis 05ZYH33]|nr:Ribosomal protein L11 methylase [Streptococcus suis 05ZYH33]
MGKFKFLNGVEIGPIKPGLAIEKKRKTNMNSWQELTIHVHRDAEEAVSNLMI